MIKRVFAYILVIESTLLPNQISVFVVYRMIFPAN